MHNGDVLGDEGRKALNSCVKVKIYGKPETRRFDSFTARRRLDGCYAGEYPMCSPTYMFPSYWTGAKRTYDIVDIHDALVNFDETKCVEKYPKEGTDTDKLRDLIDKRRADVDREFDTDGRRRYSWVVAQRRVRDCFAGNFAEDKWPVCRGKQCYDIIDIHDAFNRWDEEREKADAQRAALEKERDEADTALEKNPKHTLCRYTYEEAYERLFNCYYGAIPADNIGNILPLEIDENGFRKYFNNYYNIFDIHKALLQFDGTKLLQKYPEEGPGSEELKKLIDEHRNNLEEEYQKAKKAKRDTDSKLHEYSQSEAERRVRDCFAGAYLGDTEIFCTVKKDKNDQTYDISDIQNAIKRFDTRTFADVCKYKSKGSPDYDKSKQRVDKLRADIQSEYDIATTSTEIEHGSGFIVYDHFIITNKHVIQTYLNETESYEIRISNEAIGELACKVAHYDVGKDLALLYCSQLNLERTGICPLQLFSQSLLPGMSIFSFGYPMSHTEETALFVSGNVSGSKKTLAGHSMVVLNCSLNSGNSGGPVMCRVKGQLKVVGVATQKHFKDILTLQERETIEHIRESLQTHSIPDAPEYVGDDYSFTDYYTTSRNKTTPMFLLTLKLYDALETHSQFNLSNALPGRLLVEFIKDSVRIYTGECKEELAEIIKLSEDRV